MHTTVYFALKAALGRKGRQLIGLIMSFSTALMLVIALLLTMTPAAHASTTTRLKDIVAVEGIRDNLLVGYGLVVGLDGTGDNLKNSAFTEESLQNFLSQLGVGTSGKEIDSKNIAAVTVTSTLPAFARAGSRIDVSVSTIGDADSLQGGTLVATPLMGANGDVYAVAQGAVTVSGFSAEGNDGSSINKGVPTSGLISSGAIIEREVAFELDSLNELNLALRNPDIATATRVAGVINRAWNRPEDPIARVRDPGTVLLRVPEEYKEKGVTNLLAKIEPLEIETDQRARIIIDEASGTIVMNENVRIDTVAIAQGNLVVAIQETEDVSQPDTPFGGGSTVTTNRSEVTVTEGGKKLAVMDSGASLKELVNGLNALGIGPRDLITILQTIRAAGALQAEIVTR